MTVDVLVVGSLNADLVVRTPRFPGPGETVKAEGLRIGPGGKGGNQAVAARRLGATVRLVGAVGDDAHGSMLLEAARSTGIDVSGVQVLERSPSGVALITVDGRGENTIVVAPGANDSLDPGDAAAAVEQAGRHGVLCLSLETPTPIAVAAARASQEGGRMVILNLSPYREVPNDLLDLVDVLVVNEHEAAQLCGGTYTARRFLQAMYARGVGRSVVTLGARGCVVLDPTSDEPIGDFAAEMVDNVVDTTGAGDAFLGSLAANLAAGRDLTEAARGAVAAASLTITTEGAQAPAQASPRE